MENISLSHDNDNNNNDDNQMLVNWCCLCRENAETVDHLLLHCSVAHQLWSLLFAMFGMTWVQPGSVQRVLWSWQGGRVGKRRRKAWFFALHCLLWLLWLERNRRTFQNLCCTVANLKSRFLFILRSWLTCQVSPDLFSFLDFLDGLAP